MYSTSDQPVASLAVTESGDVFEQGLEARAVGYYDVPLTSHSASDPPLVSRYMRSTDWMPSDGEVVEPAAVCIHIPFAVCRTDMCKAETVIGRADCSVGAIVSSHGPLRIFLTSEDGMSTVVARYVQI